MNKPDLAPHGAWITVATFDAPAEAGALESFLVSQGMLTHIQDERRLQRFWLSAPRQEAGIHVQVPTENSAEAWNLLNSAAGIEVHRRAIRCPSCYSSRVQYPQMTRKNCLPALVAEVAIALRIMERECYCEECHYTWVRRQAALRS